MKHEEYERMYRFEDTYWWFVSRRHLIVSLLETYYPRKSDLRILDIGCGTGAMLEELSDFGTVTGADFALEALHYCRERNPDQTLARADARCLPFATGSFDVVTAMDVVEHIDNDKAAMSEILRVLKPGGRVFVTVPAYQSLWSEHDEALHHYRRYTSGSLKDVFQRVGLQVERLSYAVTSLFPLAWAYRKAQNLLPKRRENGEKQANLIPFSPPVNQALIGLLRKEAEFVRRASLPFGLTVACVARKRSD